MKYTYNLIVIGAGSGGLVAAELAANLGAKVALVEASDSLGGECLHAGCVPSKSFIHAARAAWNVKNNENIGVQAADVQVDFAEIMRHVYGAIRHIETHHDNDMFYEKLGIDVIHARAEFINRHTVQVGERRITARRIIIASGSAPTIPPVKGLDSVQYLTNETVFGLDTQPASLTIIGGGPIGCELGQAFAMLGTRVTIIQSGPRLLPRDEPEASAAVLESLKQTGVDVLLDVHATAVEQRDGNLSITVEGRDEPLIAEQLLIATGRTPNLVPGLERAGVKPGERGIEVDDRLRTNISNIYAIGDCNARAYFTHTAAEQAVIAVQNALFGFHKKYNDTYIPWVTFTLPEAAHFGATKEQLTPGAYERQTLSYSEIDKAVAEGEDGYIEVLTDKNNKILGATIVGANASELIGYLAMLQHKDAPFSDIAGSIQAYPTYSLGLKQLASNKLVTDAIKGARGRFIKFILKVRN